MIENRNPQLEKIWRQEKIPVIFLKEEKGSRLLVKLPFAKNNREWLQGENRIFPEWMGSFKCWKVPKSWITEIVKKCLARYGFAYVIQPFHPHEKCAPACWNAKGIECRCSCLGEHHGSGKPDGKWYEVSETLAVCWGERHYGCKMVTPFVEKQIC